MTLSDLAALGSFVSGIAVLVSLVYLSLQVRQAEKNQRALVQQARVSRSSDALLKMAESDMTRAFLKATTGAADTTGDEFQQFTFIVLALMRAIEDAYFQHDIGLMDDASLQNQLSSVRAVLATPGGRATWNTVKLGYDKRLADRIDAILATLPARSPADSFNAWKAELAKGSN